MNKLENINLRKSNLIKVFTTLCLFYLSHSKILIFLCNILIIYTLPNTQIYGIFFKRITNIFKDLAKVNGSYLKMFKLAPIGSKAFSKEKQYIFYRIRMHNYL